MTVTGGRVFEIAPEDPRQCVWQDRPDVFKPGGAAIAAGPVLKWRFQAGSVSAVDIRRWNWKPGFRISDRMLGGIWLSGPGLTWT